MIPTCYQLVSITGLYNTQILSGNNKLALPEIFIPILTGVELSDHQPGTTTVRRRQKHQHWVRLVCGALGVTSQCVPNIPFIPYFFLLVISSVVISFCSASVLCVLIRRRQRASWQIKEESFDHSHTLGSVGVLFGAASVAVGADVHVPAVWFYLCCSCTQQKNCPAAAEQFWMWTLPVG